jgi:hypothetical protein
MKKTLLLIFMVAASVALCVTGAWAYQFNPIAEVESYQGTSVTSWNGGYWHPVIADSNDPSFNIQGANWVSSTSTLNIFTSFPAATGDLGAVAADLSLYSAGTTWAVRLSPISPGGGVSTVGELFKNPSYNTSIYYFGSTGDIYGGADNPANPKPAPVWATSGLVQGITVPVTWASGEVEVDLAGIPGFNTRDFSFLYASGTCANSILTGSDPVPLPPSVLLLGSGLMGLAFLRRRRVEPKKVIRL